MMDKFIQPFSYCPNSVSASYCWRRLSNKIKLMAFVKCVGCWIGLRKASQWMGPERIAVNLRITGVYALPFGLATSLPRALALGGDPIPPS